jgi:hypothetical protein
MIIALISHAPTLASLALVSSSFLRAARIRLYRTIHIDIYPGYNLNYNIARQDWIACAPASYPLFLHLSNRRNAHLAALVQHVTIEVDYVWAGYELHEGEFLDRWRERNNREEDEEEVHLKEGEEADTFWREVEDYSIGEGEVTHVLRPFLRRLQNLKSFDLDVGVHMTTDDIWQVLSRHPFLESVEITARNWGEEEGLHHPILPRQPAFPSLKQLEAVVWMKVGQEERLRRWCERRGIEVALDVFPTRPDY